MDKSPVSAQQLGVYYRIDGSKLERYYKNQLSDFTSWTQRDHCTEWVLQEENLGVSCCIDETMIGDDIVTILSNRQAHGREGSIVAMVKGTAVETVSPVLMLIPEDMRRKVKEVTMDFSDSMRGIVRKCFPEARITLDNFHATKLLVDGIEELRLKNKRESVTKRNRDRREFNSKKAECKRRNKKYAKSHPCRHNGKKRGRKPLYTGTFKPYTHINGDTEIELLTRCRNLLSQNADKWSDGKRLRAKILFERYPKLREVHSLLCKWRAIFRNKNLTRETARVKIHEWYDAVTKCSVREIKAVKETFKEREEDILNFFIDRSSNAPAESLNSKIKCFRTQLRGVSDTEFFIYRVMKVLG